MSKFIGLLIFLLFTAWVVAMATIYAHHPKPTPTMGRVYHPNCFAPGAIRDRPWGYCPDWNPKVKDI